MTTIFPNLESKMIEYDVDISKLAHLLWRSENETAALLRGESEFTMSEVAIMCGFFNEPDTSTLLFPVYTNRKNRKSQENICGDEVHV